MKHLEVAFSQYGIREIPGKEDNPEVLKYFSILGFDAERLKDETAWCSAYVNWVCIKSNLPYTGKLNARSWLNVGEKVDEPRLGDIVVLWRESPESWKGHVGIYINETNRYLYVLGGNQNNQVNIRAYPKSRLLQYRRLT